MIEAVDRLDRNADVDVIVVARGGGSVEDLLPFSDEALIRAVHQARTPVVSAIGHEPDQPLLDLVADVRASTPTDAAKLVVPDVVEELRAVDRARDRIRAAVAGFVAREQAGLDALRSRPALADPRSLVAARADEVDQLRDRARRCLRHALDRATDDLGHQRARARALSPAGHPAARLRRPPGRRRPRRHLGRRRRRRRRRRGPGRRRPDPRHHHPGRGRPRRGEP